MNKKIKVYMDNGLVYELTTNKSFEDISRDLMSNTVLLIDDRLVINPFHVVSVELDNEDDTAKGLSRLIGKGNSGVTS